MRVWIAAMTWSVALLAALPVARAAEPSSVWKDGWTINTPTGSNWLADGSASAFRYLGAPSASYTPGLATDPYAFADYSLGHTLRFGHDYGLGNMQMTLGVRAAQPLASSGEAITAYDPRRYAGIGPRIGFEGNNTLKPSWVVDWKVGASVLSGDRSFETAIANPLVPGQTGGSALNVDGLLGLSYWFGSASKLTLGYRADYFKTSPAFNLTGAAADNADRINHGPLLRFSIQK
jgi:hypothetical protein